MKILGRIKKSKVLTAVMTAVLIFQSACPAGLAYAAQKSGVSTYAAGQTIDQALGATKTVESVLSQHENDEYYLTTPYGNKGPHGEGGAIDTWDCWKPKGEYGSGAYMNCAGFVVAVLRACGANTSIIGNYTAKDGYNRGNEANASKWEEYCRDNNAVSYTFSSKEQMLASGILEKGDIIYMEPVDWNHSNSDCHIGFFWGSSSSEDLYWHSSSHADGIVKGYFPNSAGGNVISKITPKYPVSYYRVIKTLHKGYLTLHKDSSNKTLTDTNDCYSLAGAEYGVYTDSNCSNKVATLTTNASGNANTVSLNPGRYYVKETKAPKGYFTDSQVYTADVSGANRESSPVKLSVSDNPANDPMAMLLGKYDGQKTYNGAGNLPQGSATLAGAEFTVDYYATLDYKSYDDLKNADVKPTRSWTFKTNENGIANFKADDFVSGDTFYYNSNNDPCIPRGTVVIRETKAPAGYVKSDDVSFQKIQENPTTGAVRTYNVPKVAEQVYRSDIEFTKKADNGSAHLAGVPFKVTSLTTGESHIAVTDENGYFSSASSWNAHDSNTNANDWALTASGTIDSTKLDANAGFWFGNNSVLDGNGTTATSDAVKADNKLGALPFDTYSVEELRCSANEGYALINTTVTVTRDAKTIDLGTFDDPEPEIHTTAYDASDSDHYVGVGTVKISDKVEYSHLVAGKTYTVIGELHDAATGDAVTVNGQAITAEKTFTAEDSAGSVTLDYTFDSYDLKGKTLVVYETLTDANGAKLAEHRDKSDVSQQVTVLTPKLSTSAVDDADNDKSVTAEGDVTVTDYVRYTGLTAGQTYTLSGTLMDKSTKKAFVDADGNPVTATAGFTADAESGIATATFTFDASGIKTGTKLVAFETISTNGIEIAVHKDINDIDQTVTVKAPVIGTTAVDAADGDKTVTGEENVAVRDTVHYNNVTPGKTYKVIGTLYEKVLDKNGKVTKKVFKDKNGTPITAEANFTAEDSYGNVDVTFYFDGSSLKEGTSLVAFESLSYNDKEIVSHADVNDSGQTVIITKPKLSTTATDALDGDKNLIGEDNATIADTVHYMNVTPGKTYKVSGTLYEKVTDKDGKVAKKQLLDADGNPVTAETEFVPEDTYGTVDVTFAFDASDLKAKDKVVAFESLSLNGKELASHADIEDKSQTVTITKPEVGTTAKDGFDGNQTVVSDTEVSVVDTVKYKNVTPGKTYKVSGTLYEKVTDKDGKVAKKQLLDADGNPVTAETEFVPEDTYGTVDVTFAFDASDLKAKDKVVAFESLSLNGKELASHADIEDKSQTVTITKPEVGTTAKDGFDGNQTVVSDTEVSVVDTVKYKNVTPGKTYKVSGTLYEKVTDKDGKVAKKQLLDADGNPVTAETEFVPDDTYGTVDVTFTFDGSLLKDNTPVVAFESLSYKGKEIASHSDIEDEDQTVTMHTSKIGTTAMDKLDGDKTVIADAESTVTDEVSYDHVLTGKAYTMAGILMDAKTGLPVLTGEGAKKYTEDDLTKFTSGLMSVLGFQSNTYSIKVKGKDWGNGAAIVKNADGSYTYDASERTENADGTCTVKTDTQTLTEQEDGTWKLTCQEGNDTGPVRNIEETYKADEVEVTDNGIDWSNAKKLPTASIDLAKVKAYAEENKDLLSCLVYKTAEFTPEKESGSIDMDFTFNSNDVIDRLSGETKNLVVFEVMFKGSIENASDETPVSIVASECDKDNEGQTVKLAPSTIGTTATDKSDGDHELMAGKDAVITDEVKYEGLIPGKEYTLHATLMDKKTGEPLKVADKGVTAELKFTPNSESGTVSINLGEFDATSLDGHTLVVFEELTKQSDIDGKATDVTVAEHKDINDEGQSVTVTSTPAGSTYGKTGVDMTNIAIAIGILLIAAGCATAYGIKSRKTTKDDADESAEDNTEA